MKKLPVSSLKVLDIMTTEVVTVSFDMSIEQIMRLFIQKKISGAPVVEDSGNRLLSVVSEADLIRFAAMDDLKKPLITFVQKLVDQEKIWLAHPEDPFSKVYEQFLKTSYRRIPIVDSQGIVQGVVSRQDIMKGFLKVMGEGKI